jgi:hypothetical protein
MEVLKNDPRGVKLRLLVPVLTVTAIGILFVSGGGATLRCEAADGACQILRRDGFTSSAEQFNWREVRAVRDEFQTTRYASGGSARVATTENIVLDLTNARKLGLLPAPLPWSFGTLERSLLERHVSHAPPAGSLWRVSLGMKSWFLAFISGMIGAFFALFAVVVPIDLQGPADELRSARITNLIRFSIWIVVFGALWAGILYGLVYWFASGL